MGHKSGERTLIASVVMSASGPIVVGIGLLLGRSSTQLADFIRRSVELIAIIVSWIVFRILHKSGETNVAMKVKLERTADLFVGVALCVSGTGMIFVALFSPAVERGNVIPGLVIAMLGVVANTWFWLRYRMLNRENPDAILAVQSKLYLAKPLVDACVTITLTVIAVAPLSPVSGYVDLVGSIIVAAYLVLNGIITIRVKAGSRDRENESMIDKELRITGLVMRVIPKIFFTESGLRLLNKLSNKRWIKAKSHSIQFTEVWIDRKDGSNLRICVFKALETKEDLPGLLWLHGGGYALGAPEQAEKMVKMFMEASNCIVIAPDYRLSIEAPYPAALEDCYETLLWMKSNANELGIKNNQLMVGGDSSGGGLAAALTLYARDKGEVAIAYQMPLYPMIDDRMSSKSAKNNHAPVWNSKSNYICWKLYLGPLFGTTNVPYYAAPARARDYNNLPPAATFVGELEPFRDETIQYVENLRLAGVPVDFEIFKGCYHAFEQMCPNAKISKKAVAFIINSFKYAVEHYFAEQNRQSDLP